MQVPQETSVSRDYGRFSIKLSTLGSYKTNTENPCIYAKFLIYLAILHVVQSINCYGISQADVSINVCRDNWTGVIRNGTHVALNTLNDLLSYWFALYLVNRMLDNYLIAYLDVIDLFMNFTRSNSDQFSLYSAA